MLSVGKMKENILFMEMQKVPSIYFATFEILPAYYIRITNTFTNLIL